MKDVKLKSCRFLLCFLLVFLSTSAIASDSSDVVSQPKIVGGSEAQRGAWPFIAALVAKGQQDLANSQFCGGSLIDSRWVMTASHCLPEETPDTLEVILGVHDLENDTVYTRVGVDEIYMHASYDAQSNENDIALLKLSRPITSFTAIGLNTSAQIEAPGTTATVMGWGTTSEGGQPSPVLLQVDVDVVSLETANNTGAFDAPLTEDMLPAGFPEGGKDSCQGDSGGPLVAPDGQGGHKQIGVVSWGVGCAQPNAYGVYARVSHFDSWLQNRAFSTKLPGDTLRMKNKLESAATDPNRPQAAYYYEEYELASLTVGEPITFQVRSNAFSPYLTIFNSDTDAVISNHSLQGSSAITVTLTPQQGINYGLGISSLEASATGVYELNYPPQIDSGGNEEPPGPTISVGDVVTGTLTEEDLYDSENGFYGKGYLLAGVQSGDVVTATMTSHPGSGGFYPYISVYNSANGNETVNSGWNEKTSVSVSFTVAEGIDYIISAENLNPNQKGDYELSVTGQGSGGGTLSGTVTTNFAGHSDLTVIGATVTVQETGDSTKTDASGQFSFTGLPSQVLTLVIAAQGLSTFPQTVDLSAGQSVTDFSAAMPVSGSADVNGDGKVGVDDAVKVLQTLIQ